MPSGKGFSQVSGCGMAKIWDWRGISQGPWHSHA
jgi:hypothetical protein